MRTSFWKLPAAGVLAASLLPAQPPAAATQAREGLIAQAFADAQAQTREAQREAERAKRDAEREVERVKREAERVKSEVKRAEIGRWAEKSSYLGVGVAEITAERARELKLSEEQGVEITKVQDDSPAAKAGLQVGDVVLEYNGDRVEGVEQFARMVRETPPGRHAKLLVHRKGASLTVPVTIGTRDRQFAYAGPRMRIDVPMPEIRIPEVPQAMMSWRSSALGVVAEALEGQLADFFGAKEGVLVRSVLKDSAAEKAGIKAGDVILKIDDRKVTSPREITSAIRALRPKRSFPVTLLRNRQEMSVTVTLEDDRGGDLRVPPRMVSMPPAKVLRRAIY